MSKRRTFTSKFKTKVVLEAIKGHLTLSEIAQKHKIQPNQITTWKKEFLSNAETVFDKGEKKKPEPKEDTKELLKKIGELTIENDFLRDALQ